jgi:hypothetical protein
VKSQVRVRTPKDALLSAFVGAWAVLMMQILAPEPTAIGLAGVLLSGWLCIGCIVQWWTLRERAVHPIPIAFSGSTGRLRISLRPREVIVQSGLRTVARASRTFWGDRLVVHPDLVDGADLASLGVAIGQAIQVLGGGTGGDGERASGPRDVAAVDSRKPHPTARSASSGVNVGGPMPRLPLHQRPTGAYRPLTSLTRGRVVSVTRLDDQRLPRPARP